MAISRSNVHLVVPLPDTGPSSPFNGLDSLRSERNRRTLHDWMTPSETTELNADITSSTSSTNQLAATHYLHVTPIPNKKDSDGQPLVLVKAVLHDIPVSFDSYGLKFGNNRAKGDSGILHPRRRALSDWMQLHNTTAFNADYGSSTGEKNGWAVTHYLRVTPVPGEKGSNGEKMVQRPQAVPHSTPVSPVLYG